MQTCIEAGLNFGIIRSASGQWEFQLFKGKKAGDEIWIARYLLID